MRGFRFRLNSRVTRVFGLRSIKLLSRRTRQKTSGIKGILKCSCAVPFSVKLASNSCLRHATDQAPQSSYATKNLWYQGYPKVFMRGSVFG